MMHLMLKFLNFRWLLSQNIAHFLTLQKILKFLEILNKTADVKMRGNFQYLGRFLSIPRLARMFYMINIKKIFEWSKNG